MEMSWLETIELIGLDLQVGVILALFGLDLLEHAMHTAWSAFSQWRTVPRVQPATAHRVAVGQIHTI